MEHSAVTLWMARAGRFGEREHFALAANLAVIGWDELPDLSACASRDALAGLLRQTYPAEKPRTLGSWLNQIWPVRDTMQNGDLVALPLKGRPAVAFGTVTGPYRRVPDANGAPVHSRPVQWHAQVPRAALDADMIFSLGAFMTVCRIGRNNAEERARALVDLYAPAAPHRGGADGGLRPDAAWRGAGLRGSGSLAGVASAEFEQRAALLIRQRVAQRFKGHDMAVLVAGVLASQGYKLRLSAPGVDGGVDIRAGGGPFGLDAPRLVVQVKSQDTPVDVHVLRELGGVMRQEGAEQGLLVGWGGFTQAVRQEAARDWFRLRLWDAADLVAAVGAHYRQLDARLQAALPLKQVWTLAPDAHADAA